jgi:DNA-binding transcriptional MerR regulator
MSKFYNKKSLVSEIRKRIGIILPYITLIHYEKKGYLKSEGRMPDGNRTIPVYTEKNLLDFIERLMVLKNEGKVRLTRTKEGGEKSENNNDKK